MRALAAVAALCCLLTANYSARGHNTSFQEKELQLGVVVKPECLIFRGCIKDISVNESNPNSSADIILDDLRKHKVCNIAHVRCSIVEDAAAGDRFTALV